MKRRDILKGLTLLPLSGKLLANEDSVGIPGANRFFSNPAADQNIFRMLGVEPLINCRGPIQ
jgi:D-glucosaminate-6-phosphate ammonia-lyase